MREFAKLEALAEEMADRLRKRGALELPATLASGAGMAAFAHASIEWLHDPSVPLKERLDLAHVALRSLIAERASPGH